MRVFGAGVGRTGTWSLKLAIQRLGLGPCHHMETVLRAPQAHARRWRDVRAGRPDWAALYDGCASAVDWPTAGYFRELSVAFPAAKFVLTLRDALSWAESYAATIHRLMAMQGMAPPHLQPWFDMAGEVIADSGFPQGLDAERLVAAYEAHNRAVVAAIPADRLLQYRVTDGWAPLCAFLDRPVPDEPFPCTNQRAEFWGRVVRDSWRGDGCATGAGAHPVALDAPAT